MGLLDRLFGRGRSTHDQYDGYQQTAPYGGHQAGGGPALPGPGGTPGDQQAVERYRYLLRTAPPDKIEEAHAEAFAQLTPQQRQEVLVQLAAAVPASERPRSDDPRTLARAATRAEVRQPGTLERAFGPGGGGPGGGYGPGYGGGYGGGYGRGGPGFGSMVGAGLLGTVGGLVVGTAVADALFDSGIGDSGLFGGGDEEAYAQGSEDAGGDGGGDYGGDLAGGADPSGDFGGGDFGGGDFGGGDF